MSESATPYLHGTSPEEQDRLALMNSILNERELAAIELRGDEHALEMGAGTGVFAAALAQSLPEGEVVAIERDPRQVAEARKRVADVSNLELRQGDVYDPPLEREEWGSFDLVHARFLLEHLERPAEAVRVMVRAARPGGRIVLIDDDHSLMRLWPDPGGYLELWEAFARQFEELGMDPIVGRRLVALLAEAGAVPERNTLVFYGGCSSEPGFSAVVENMARVVDSARERLVTRGGYTADELDRILTDLIEWGRGEGRAVWYGLPLAVGRKP